MLPRLPTWVGQLVTVLALVTTAYILMVPSSVDNLAAPPPPPLAGVGAAVEYPPQGIPSLGSIKALPADAGPMMPPGGKFDSDTAVVMTVAEWDDASSFERFVGSLRWSGYNGKIVIGVITTHLWGGNARWLEAVGVEVWPIVLDNCAHSYTDKAFNDKQKCPAGLTDFKLQWASYAIALMWIEQHPECTGGVLFTDFHAYFQANPFESVTNPQPVMLFAEHENVTTKHWLVDYPVTHCRKVQLGDKPMISAGAVMGSRAGVASFFKAVVKEFQYWVARDECRFPSDDAQAVVNYLVYSGRWDAEPWKPVVMPFRTSVFAAVGVLGSHITERMGSLLVHDATKRQWIDPATQITDNSGFLLNLDGSRAAFISQWETLGPTFKIWLDFMVHEVFVKVADGEAKREDLPGWIGGAVAKSPRAVTQAAVQTGEVKPTGPVSVEDTESKCIPIPKTEAVFPEFGWPKGVNIAAREAELEAAGLAQHSPNAVRVFIWNDKNPNKHREVGNLIDGLVTHPRYAITEVIADADMVIWISTMVRHENEVVPIGCKNVLVLDYSDGCVLQKRRTQLKHGLGYFKRSYISRNDGIKTGECAPMPTAWPLAYSGTQRMVLALENIRTLEIVCTLRDGGAWFNKVRARIIDWTNQFIKKNAVPNTVVDGQITAGSHNSQAGGENKYTRTIHSAKIIVTCNPATWEGDHRLYEALLTGALVFIDKMDVLPMLPFPYEHKKHLIVYDSHKQAEFDQLMMYYWQNPGEAREIAKAGYQWTLDHHMPKDRVDYIFSVLNPPIGTSNGTVVVGGQSFTT